MNSPDSQLFIVSAAAVLALLAIAFAVLIFSRLKQVSRRLDEAETALALNGEHYQGLAAGALGQGQRLLQLEQDFARLRSRLEEVAASGDGNGSAFNQAIRMARKGCSAREIMETCGLGEIEADLVVLMHKSGRID
jgi:uncharacterized protein YoxC